MTATPAPEGFDAALGFCKFRIPRQGGRVIWEVTNACNYGCRYCIFSSTSRKPDGELGTARAMGLLDELAAAGFSHVKFTGGEPFLRPDMAGLLEHADALALSVDISTNASLIDAGIAARLAALNLPMVHVSLDGATREAQEAVRGRNSHEPTLRGLRLLVEHGVRVRIGCLIHLANQDAIEDAVAAAAGLGADEIIFSMMEPVGRMRGRPSLLATISPAEARDRVAGIAPRWSGRIRVSHSITAGTGSRVLSTCQACPGGTRFLFINHAGQISPCTWVTEHLPGCLTAGSLHGMSLAALLEATELRHYHRVATAAASENAGCPMDNPSATAAISQAILDADPGADAGTRFGPAAPIYAFATENLAYMRETIRPGDAVLTVLGSGDHVIEACLAGASTVLAFDINRRALYYAELKLAALMNLDHADYRRFLLPGPDGLAHAVYRRLRPSLSPACRAFFDILYADHGNDGAALRASSVFNTRHDASALKDALVPHLRSPDAHAAARAAVAAASVRTVQATAETASQTCDGVRRTPGWNAIILSNLADHSHRMFPGEPGDGHITAFRDRVVVPLAAHLAPAGRMMAGYVYDADNRHGSDLRNAFNDPVVRRAAYGLLPGFSYREIQLPGALGDGGTDAATMLFRVAVDG